MTGHHSASISTSVITAFVALIPGAALTYAEKLLSVLVLAMAAEAGRRIIGLIWKTKGKQ